MVGTAADNDEIININKNTLKIHRSNQLAIDELLNYDEDHSKVIKIQSFIANSQDVCFHL